MSMVRYAPQFYVPSELVTQFESEIDKTGVTKSTIFRWAMEKFVKDGVKRIVKNK